MTVTRLKPKLRIVEEPPEPPSYRKYIRGPMHRFEPTEKQIGDLIVTSRGVERINP